MAMLFGFTSKLLRSSQSLNFDAFFARRTMRQDSVSVTEYVKIFFFTDG